MTTHDAPTQDDWLAYHADLAAYADDPRDEAERRIADAAAMAELDAWVEAQAMANESVSHDVERGGWANEDDIPEAA